MNRNLFLVGSVLGWFVACSDSTRLGEGQSDDPRVNTEAGGGEAGSGEPGMPSNGTGGSAGIVGGSAGTVGGSAGTVGGSAGTVGEPSPPEGGSAGTAGEPGPTDGGTGGSAEPPGMPDLPCDVLEGAGHVCVAAHSTVRVLVSGYTGSLYQVQRSDGTTQDIGSVDGYADAAAQDAFCEESSCVVKIIYDQSPMGNHLTEAPPGGAKPTPGKPVAAVRVGVTINGRPAYGLLFRPGEGYRKLVGNGTAVGDEPQTIYMVSSQHDLINGCCFEYGNAETSANNDGNGTAEAVYFGMGVIWGTGTGRGPWVMADLENGLYAGWENGQDRNISSNTPLAHDFVTAVLVGDTADKNQGRGRFALYGGDATNGALKTLYDGIRPEKPGYAPMQKQGSIVLSVAGDNSDADGGRFYEGIMANGAATRETLDALQAAIVSAGYSQ